MHHLSWLEAAVVGLLQGVSELFPLSSLGHSVLLPAVLGGAWARDLNVAAPESPYLAFIVGTHVATAVALLVFYRRDWARLVRAFFTSFRHRGMATPRRAADLAAGRGHDPGRPGRHCCSSTGYAPRSAVPCPLPGS